MSRIHVFVTWIKRPDSLETVLADETPEGLVEQIERALAGETDDCTFQCCGEQIRDDLPRILDHSSFKLKDNGHGYRYHILENVGSRAKAIEDVKTYYRVKWT